MATKTKRFIKVEGVNKKINPKFAKFTSGGLFVENAWLNVAKGVDIDQFEKGGTYEVEIEVNDKGYSAIIGVPSLTEEVKPVEQKKAINIPVPPADTKLPQEKEKTVFVERDRSMLLGGLLHDAAQLAAAQSAALSPKETLELVKEYVDGLLKIREQVK